jgi:hypothetical protein
VEAINSADSSIIASTITDSLGGYSLPVPAETTIKIRVKAQMLNTGSPSWDFQVVDNTNSKALYVMDSASFDTGSSGVANKDLNASSGWGGLAYTSTRVAAPFALLDTIYKAVAKIKLAAPTINMPQLLINWSINNRTTDGNKAIGEIGTSHFDSSENQLYILGKENLDTDEYDDHVVAHEWGHYFEHNLSRSDSIGGSHSGGDKLDPRVAFGEGFGNAFSGMALDEPIYLDTKGAKQATVALNFDLSSSTGDADSVGWFSEDSVQYILYSLYSKMGFSPLYNVLTGDQKNALSYTTIHSFISFLKANNPAYVSLINGYLTTKNISTIAIDQWDSTETETNNAGNTASLPVYKKLTVGAAETQVCVNDDFGRKNKLMNRRFIYFNVTTAGSYTITASVDTAGGIPNIIVFSKGVKLTETDNTVTGPATLTGTLPVGFYAGEIYDKRHLTSGSATGNVCFNVKIN